MNEQTASFTSPVDQYVYQTLLSINGTSVVVQTTKGTVTGRLQNVLPDHIVVESGGSSFFIRTQQIVWVIPRG